MFFSSAKAEARITAPSLTAKLVVWFRQHGYLKARSQN
jgi:hypothetical protein